MTDHQENRIQRWLRLRFGTAREEAEARIAEQFRQLEQIIFQKEMEVQNLRDMIRRMEQTLEKEGMALFAFSSGDRVKKQLGSAGKAWVQALTENGTSLPEALAQAGALEHIAVMIQGQQRQLAVRAHPGQTEVFYTVQDVTELCGLHQARQEAWQQEQEALKHDPATGLCTQEALLEKAEAFLSADTAQNSVCALHISFPQRDGVPACPVVSPDRFLRKCGQALRARAENALFARGDGDAVLGLVFDCEAEKLPQLLGSLHDCVREQLIHLAPEGVCCHDVILGAAADTENCRRIPELLQQAKLAAWQARRSGDRGIAWFDPVTGNPVLERLADFQELVEGKQVAFLVQPIVRSSNAKAEGYELIMESRHPRLVQMDRVFELADFLGRRQELERLLWFQGMAKAADLMRTGKLFYNQKIWLPTVSGTCLSDRDCREFEETYFDYLQHIVLETAETGYEAYSSIKRQRAARWGMASAVAVSAWNRDGELALCGLQPEWIRAEGALVQGIANDREKQRSFTALRTFAAAHGCRILAAGIENGEDLSEVIRLGADCLQGDYLGRAETTPADIPEKRIQQIGQAQYGKRG